MRPALAVVAVSAAVLTAGTSAAQDQRWNLDAGAAGVDLSEGEAPALMIRTGRELGPILSLEGEALVGLDDVPIRVAAGGSGSIKMTWDGSVWAVGRVPVTDNFQVFARAGLGGGEVTTEAGGVERSQTDYGLGWGLGAQLHFHADYTVRVDWTHRERDFDTDAWGVTLGRRF